MSNKTFATGNNENLCPILRKRSKPGSVVKLNKINKFDTSSPNTLSLEVLNEMGISVIDSEESSSSVASTLGLAISTSTDENSNEATPNSNALVLTHNYHCTMNTTLNKNDSSFIDPNETLKASSLSMSGVENASKFCNNSEENDGSDGSKEHVHLRSLVTRSPLSTVSTNTYNRSATKATQMHQISNIQPQFQTMCFPVAEIATKINTPIDGTVATSNSPLFNGPSTSQQAILHRQQQRQQQQQQQHHHQQKQQQKEANETNNNDIFFLYRYKEDEKNINTENYFTKLSDEMMLQIFGWLPKKALKRCCSVSQRFNQCARDESLWVRLDLAGRTIRAGAMEDILLRGVTILRLAQSEINHPIFITTDSFKTRNFVSKLQYLDLSMANITKSSLKMLLTYCQNLKKLSLEHVPVNDEICYEIAKNVNMEALNLSMCVGLAAWAVRRMVESLQKLTSLNIAWTSLSLDAITALVTNISPHLIRLNLAGCRKTMFDSHLTTLVKRCPNLLELDISDCILLTGKSITTICDFKMLEYLSISRCYNMPTTSYLELGNLKTLKYLDVFGILSDNSLAVLEEKFPKLGINKFIHSSVARPTVGSRRTSIWGLKTRD